jgi:anti-sigma factor RsiW
MAGENTDAALVRPTDVLTCFITRRRLGALVDGALDEREFRSASAHVVDCVRCHREADELRRLRMMVRRSLAGSAPGDWAGFWPGIVRGIEDRGREPVRLPARPLRRVLARPRVALSGAIAALLLVSFSVWQFWSAESPPVTQSAVVVRSANTEMPGASLMVFSPPEQDMAVVWMLAAEEGEE